MRVFQSGTDAQGHWLCYDEPSVHFVEITTTNHKQQFFYLPFPGMVIYCPGMSGKLAAGWPWVALTPKGCPINKDGTLSKRAQFNIVPLGHVYDYGSVCIYNKVPRPTIQAVLTEFWQSRATYFVEGKISEYVHKHFPGTLTGSKNDWSYFKKTDFFDDWENNWTLENIEKAPFMNLSIVSGGRRVHVDTLGPWREIEVPELKEKSVAKAEKPRAMAAK